MSKRTSSSSPQGDNQQVFWLGYAVFAMVVLVLLTIVWAIISLPRVNSGPPRSAVERQLRVLGSAVDQNPKNAELWGEYIRILVLTEQYSMAEREITRADKVLKGRKAEVAAEVVRMALERDDPKKAEAESDKALKLAEDEREKLIADLREKGTAITPKPGALLDVLLLRARLFIETERDAEAIEALTGALELKPEMAEVIAERAGLYEKSGDKSRALRDFRRVLNFIPDHEGALAGVARLEAE